MFRALWWREGKKEQVETRDHANLYREIFSGRLFFGFFCWIFSSEGDYKDIDVKKMKGMYKEKSVVSI